MKIIEVVSRLLCIPCRTSSSKGKEGGAVGRCTSMHNGHWSTPEGRSLANTICSGQQLEVFLYVKFRDYHRAQRSINPLGQLCFSDPPFSVARSCSNCVDVFFCLLLLSDSLPSTCKWKLILTVQARPHSCAAVRLDKLCLILKAR